MTAEVMDKIEALDGWALDAEAFRRIEDLVPEGGTILELGSGEGTRILHSMGYEVHSVEHEGTWVSAYPYGGTGMVIHAPLKDGWYDALVVKRYIPKDYDLLIVDGPVGSGPRIGIMRHLDLFRRDIPWIIDDTHRPHEAKMAQVIARELNFDLEAVDTTNEIGKQFCILTPRTEDGPQ